MLPLSMASVYFDIINVSSYFDLLVLLPCCLELLVVGRLTCKALVIWDLIFIRVDLFIVKHLLIISEDSLR